MIVTANPLATKAGFDILNNGGNAVDALVTSQLVLNLVEPQSSGIGGGAFSLFFDSRNKTLTSYDGREMAPSEANENYFRFPNGEFFTWPDARIGGRSIGVPGTLKMLEHMHEKHGIKPWKDLFQTAIDLSKYGFVISKRLANSVRNSENFGLAMFKSTERYFFPDGEPIKAGDTLKNPKFANTLSAIAHKGSDFFYYELAEEIANATRTFLNPGIMKPEDIKNYKVIERTPVCIRYQYNYEVCGMGPPSSGGITVNQILGMVEPFDLRKIGRGPQAYHLLAEASRLAFADRNYFIGDPDFTYVPSNAMMSKEYLNSRTDLISFKSVIGKYEAGNPLDANLVYSPDNSFDKPGTSHLSIVDRFGNIVSCTSTIESGFGSRVMVRGFLLNNELTDFSFESHRNGKSIANKVEGNKRPRSSMAPTIIFKNERPFLVIGSPGGSRIIGYVAKSIISIIDWDMLPSEAINSRHIVAKGSTLEIEDKPISGLDELKLSLEEIGNLVKIRELNSGLHAIKINSDGFRAGIDKRREGLALGD